MGVYRITSRVQVPARPATVQVRHEFRAGEQDAINLAKARAQEAGCIVVRVDDLDSLGRPAVYVDQPHAPGPE